MRHATRTRGIWCRGIWCRGLLVAGAAMLAMPGSSAVGQLPSGSWALAFADEFSGHELDRTKWSPNYSWGKTHNHMAYMDPGQLAVSDGRLRITAVKERHPDAPTHAVHDGKWYRLDYTSGAVQTANTFRFTDGYVEARMRLPGEIGAWAAFWTLGQGWPPEIDIMEYPIMDHAQNNNDKYRYWVNYHYGADWRQHRSYGKEHWQGRDLSGGYNTYGVEWTANDQLHFSLNGSRVYSITDSAAVSQLRDQYLILNYAVGGWPGTPPSWPEGGSNFDIDWVRVWQRPSETVSSHWVATGASGSWASDGNWSGGAPALAGQTARFGTVAGRTAVAVDWSGSRTLSDLVFDGSTRYSLGSGDESLMLVEGPGGDGWVGFRVSPGGPNHTINTRLDLYGRFSVWNDGGILTLARDIDEEAGGFTAVGEMQVGGSGTTIVSGQSRLSGPLAVRGGMLVVTGRLFAGSVAADAGVTVSGGTLYLTNFSEASTGSLGGLPAAADRLVIDGGTLRLAGSGTSSRGFTIGAAGATLEVQAGVQATLMETSSTASAPADGIAVTTSGRLSLVGAGSGILAKRLAGRIGVVKEGSGTWTLTAPVDLPNGSLMVKEGLLALPATARMEAVVGRLTVDESQGRLDLGSGRIAVASGGITAAALRADILAGRGDGSWNGPGGITSSAATAGRGVGYLVRADGSATVAYAAAGDVDLNGRVDVFDLVAINTAGRFGTGLPAVWSEGDATYDGVTNVFDLVAINGAGAYNTGDYRPASPAGSAPPPAAVPEPTGLAIAAAAASLALSRKSLQPLADRLMASVDRPR